jgi:hypothetical protein
MGFFKKLLGLTSKKKSKKEKEDELFLKKRNMKKHLINTLN